MLPEHTQIETLRQEMGHPTRTKIPTKKYRNYTKTMETQQSTMRNYDSKFKPGHQENNTHHKVWTLLPNIDRNSENEKKKSKFRKFGQPTPTLTLPQFIPNKRNAGGKPSTRLPPGGLAERFRKQIHNRKPQQQKIQSKQPNGNHQTTFRTLNGTVTNATSKPKIKTERRALQI